MKFLREIKFSFLENYKKFVFFKYYFLYLKSNTTKKT